MSVFWIVLAFCAGLCFGVSGLSLYLSYLNREVTTYGKTRKS